jgi:hypothetical protein
MWLPPLPGHQRQIPLAYSASLLASRLKLFARGSDVVLGPCPVATKRARSFSKSPVSAHNSRSVSSSRRTMPVRAPPANELIKLQLNRPRISVLGVLDDENQEKRDDRRPRVDHELPRIGEVVVWAEQAPDDDRDARRQKHLDELTISELRRANFRNCSSMTTSRVHTTYHICDRATSPLQMSPSTGTSLAASPGSATRKTASQHSSRR